MHDIRLLMAQINPSVGAVEQNAEMISNIIRQQQQYDLIVFPELALCGYPPEDLMLRDDFMHRCEKALLMIKDAVGDCHVIIGHPRIQNGRRYNSASVIYQGQIIHQYDKQKLPNYDVFDERRYFSPGEARACVFQVKNTRFGLCICEDIWQAGPVDQIEQAGADTLLCINASPFDYEKYKHRENLVKTHAKRGMTVVYVNNVGGQDELVFDGQSMVYDEQAQRCAQAPAFETSLCPVELSYKKARGPIAEKLSETALIYKALVTATRDYVRKNHFPGVLLGLSGGIDSALTLAIAVDALGAEQVHAVMMPSRFTTSMSLEDALKQLKTLKVKSSNLSIEPAFTSLLETLQPEFAGRAADTTEENLQARIRGVMLMAMSNKSGKMVLSTSNKSETAVGYATLYGDMCGGYAVLKDVLKTQVYQLANHINQQQEIIPQRVIDRPPSAELAEDQKDQDSLPEYAILDDIIELYMIKRASIHDIVAKGHDRATVEKVAGLIKRNEYKRRQAAPGVKISPCAFGKDWRFPITSGA